MGGGNPVLAISSDGQKAEAIFTDMLGTSIGRVGENGYSATDKTSFGTDSSDKSSFFTDKPTSKTWDIRFSCATTAPI